MDRHRDPERDHDNYISVFAVDVATTRKGNWQAIGYLNNQHVAAFGNSPVEALKNAIETLPVEDDGMDLV